MTQLPLGVRLHDRALFSSFLPGANAQPLAAARSLARAAGDSMLYLHGASGTGRSHLLQAICAEVPGSGYFPLRELLPAGPAVLEGVEGLALITLDDLDAVAEDAAWEQRLFWLYNACQASGTRLAVAAGVPATDLAVRLPDLRSRLAAMPHFALRPLDETQQREALRHRAAVRGLEIPDEVLQYLQRHFARDMGALQALLDRLDQASMRQQRRLTLPFVRDVLNGPT